MLSNTLVSWRCFSIPALCPRFFSGKLLEVLERVVSRWLDLESHLLPGLAARALACGPLAHQLQREVGLEKVRQRHIPFLSPQTSLGSRGSRAPCQAVPSRAAHSQHCPCTAAPSHHPGPLGPRMGLVCRAGAVQRRSHSQVSPVPLISCSSLRLPGLLPLCPASSHGCLMVGHASPSKESVAFPSHAVKPEHNFPGCHSNSTEKAYYL